MIGIIKYRAGNIASVSNALDRLEATYQVTDSINELDACDSIIFPGVGHASSAMEDLKSKGLDTWLKQTRKPVLGICVGMQLLYESTEEGDCQTLGIIPGRLTRFDDSLDKVPHMGWNRINKRQDHPLFNGIDDNDYFYFVHSYYAPVSEFTIAACEYTTEFTAAVARDNFMGIQFHTEKSGISGSKLIRNFLQMTQSVPG